MGFVVMCAGEVCFAFSTVAWCDGVAWGSRVVYDLSTLFEFVYSDVIRVYCFSHFLVFLFFYFCAWALFDGLVVVSAVAPSFGFHEVADVVLCGGGSVGLVACSSFGCWFG